MQWAIRDHLLVVQSSPDEALGKMVSHTFGWVTRLLPQHLPVVVWWKRAFHLKPWQEIGDGMAIVTLYERAPVAFPLDIHACLHGLLAYGAYDENTDKLQYFLYKSTHAPEELAWIETWLAKQFPTSVLHQGRFVEIGIPPAMTIAPLALDTPAQICSWLFGLSVAYGTWQMRDTKLLRVLLTIPQVGSLRAVTLACEEIKPQLRELGMLFSWQVLPGKLNDTLQISLQDTELLALFATWYTGEPLEHDMHYVTWLEEFLVQQGTDIVTAGLIAHSVLKLREK
jgi:hypothetical protein